MAHVIQKLVDERQITNHIALGIIAVYQTLLKQQTILFKQ